MQTRTMSAIETAANYTLGFALAWGVAFFALPLWGHRLEAAAAAEVTVLFTVISILRSYAIRRIFNRWHT